MDVCKYQHRITQKTIPPNQYKDMCNKIQRNCSVPWCILMSLLLGTVLCYTYNKRKVPGLRGTEISEPVPSTHQRCVVSLRFAEARLLGLYWLTLFKRFDSRSRSPDPSFLRGQEFRDLSHRSQQTYKYSSQPHVICVAWDIYTTLVQ